MQIIYPLLFFAFTMWSCCLQAMHTHRHSPTQELCALDAGQQRSTTISASATTASLCENTTTSASATTGNPYYGLPDTTPTAHVTGQQDERGVAVALMISRDKTFFAQHLPQGSKLDNASCAIIKSYLQDPELLAAPLYRILGDTHDNAHAKAVAQLKVTASNCKRQFSYYDLFTHVSLDYDQRRKKWIGSMNRGYAEARWRYMNVWNDVNCEEIVSDRLFVEDPDAVDARNKEAEVVTRLTDRSVCPDSNFIKNGKIVTIHPCKKIVSIIDTVKPKNKIISISPANYLQEVRQVDIDDNYIAMIIHQTADRDFAGIFCSIYNYSENKYIGRYGSKLDWHMLCKFIGNGTLILHAKRVKNSVTNNAIRGENNIITEIDIKKGIQQEIEFNHDDYFNFIPAIDFVGHPNGNDIGLLDDIDGLVLYKTVQGKRELLAHLTVPQLLLIEFMLAKKTKPLSTQESSAVWDTLPLVIKEFLKRTCAEKKAS